MYASSRSHSASSSVSLANVGERVEAEVCRCRVVVEDLDWSNEIGGGYGAESMSSVFPLATGVRSSGK